MKIKTVTCHHVYNYGATLQAFALQSYLESCGHETAIIDYRLPGMTRYEWFADYPPLKGTVAKCVRVLPFVKYIYYVLKRRNNLRWLGRKHAFDDFDKKYLHITNPTFRTIEDIRKSAPEADMYVAGSDQIWNTDMPNGHDEGYYLDFGSAETKRISYAASFGINEIAETDKPFVRAHLQRFDKISVREATGLKILNDLGLEGVTVTDPVFLLSQEEWIKRLQLGKTTGKDYIFLYDFTHDDECIRTFALDLAKQRGLKLVSVNDWSETPYASKQINNAGPKEFLLWLMNARYVVCNSFHATAFSLIFHKSFATFPLLRQRNASRMSDLLKNAGLLNRLKPQNINVMNEMPNWQDVDDRLAVDITKSKYYLKTK